MREKPHELSKGLLERLPAAARERLELERFEPGGVVRKAVRDAPQLARQRAEARELADELLSFRQETRLKRLHRSRGRYRSRPLVEEILHRCRLALFEDPGEGVELAELALELTLHLGHRPALCGGRRALVDLHARCLAFLGNACRVVCRFEEAQSALEDAFDLLEEGTQDELLRAELLSFRGSLLTDRRDCEGALRVLQRAETLFTKARASHFRGSVILMQAQALDRLARFEEAAECYFRAFHLLEEEKEPVLAVAGWTNLAICLHTLGRHQDARDVLAAGGPLFALCPPRSTVHLNRAWVQGMVEEGLGNLEKAERAYAQALEGFRRLEDGYNVALLTLDLAEIWMTQGRPADVERVAEGAYEGLKRYALHKEALAAFALFVDAAQAREVTEAVVRFAAQKLRQHPVRARGGAAPSPESPLAAPAEQQEPSQALTKIPAAQPAEAKQSRRTPAEELGRALSWLRRYRWRSQRDVAKAMGINSGMLSSWETGTKQPRLGTLQELLRVLDSNFSDLEAALATVRVYPPAGRRIPSHRGIDPLAHPLDHELIRAALDDSPGARTEAAAARAMLKLLVRAAETGEA